MNILLSLENNENKHSPKFRCISKRFTDYSTSEIFWLKFNTFLKEFKEEAKVCFTTKDLETIKL